MCIPRVQPFFLTSQGGWKGNGGGIAAEKCLHHQPYRKHFHVDHGPSLAPFTTATKNPRSYFSLAALILEQGYPLEIHEIETEDHYLLTAFRIPYGKKSKPGGRPVILQHGILCSSAVWVLERTDQALGFLLADNGYDVWLSNSRGNTYSKKHRYLDPEKSSDKAKFFNFSFHEMGYYDLPATIDYVLNKTGETQLYFVGHSQGTTSYFVMASTRPEYNAKVRHMSALAPIAFLDHTRGGVRAISLFSSIIGKIAYIFNLHELFERSILLKFLERTACRKTAITQPLCDNILFLIGGYDSQELNVTLVPIITSFTPAGVSIKQLLHFSQLIKGGDFRMFDYGSDNIMHYNRTTAPEYDLSKITSPVMLHYAYNDWISGVQDVNRLFQHLPNGKKKVVQFKYFNHLDFMWAIDAWELLYKDVIDNMKQN